MQFDMTHIHYKIVCFQFALTFLSVVNLSNSCAGNEAGDRDEIHFGWTMSHLDLDVSFDNAAPSMIVKGTMKLELQLEKANGITLAVNLEKPAMAWVSVSADIECETKINFRTSKFPATRFSNIQFATEKKKGDLVTVDFVLRWNEYSRQVGIGENIAIASWTDAWYPFPVPRLDRDEEFSAALISAPGKTTFRMPKAWTALSDGNLISRRLKSSRAIEVREVIEPAVARSFAAAPYAEVHHTDSEHSVSTYLFKKRKHSAEDYVKLFARIIEAQEKAFGEYPFKAIGLAEVPNRIPGWYAASQQTFLMAKTSAFEHEHINLPLWSHELCHAWWGNSIKATGDGERIIGESLAQFGALLAIEEIEGRDAAIQFREFSRSGYNPFQCAKGYFSMVKSGKDHPLSTLSISELDFDTKHNLANSKGMWFYHMLRQEVGDKIMFETLQKLAGDRRGKTLTLDELRDAFVAASPNGPKLTHFLHQWLDRPGAPRIEMKTKRTGNWITEVLLIQTQQGAPYKISIDVKMQLADDKDQLRTATFVGRTAVLAFDDSLKVEALELDPDRHILMRRQSYD